MPFLNNLKIDIQQKQKICYFVIVWWSLLKLGINLRPMVSILWSIIIYIFFPNLMSNYSSLFGGLLPWEVCNKQAYRKSQLILMAPLTTKSKKKIFFQSQSITRKGWNWVQGKIWYHILLYYKILILTLKFFYPFFCFCAY